MEILKVSAKSNPNSVAGALAGVLREKGGAEIQAIGEMCIRDSTRTSSFATMEGAVISGRKAADISMKF